MGITVIQVFNSLGIRPVPKQSWAVGSRVAAKFRLDAGHEPPKQNRSKTSGGGSHCFAVYPLSWHGTIAAVILEVCGQDEKQADLFGA